MSNCRDQKAIGTHCNISSDTCYILNPCENNATHCSTNRTTNLPPYTCECLPGFYGKRCQYHYQSCKPTMCWNNGSELVFLHKNNEN